MKSNEEVKGGRAIFSEEISIRKNSLKLYTYLTCHAYLRNSPRVGGPNVRIFQQKDLNLSQINRSIKMDPRTIKKCLHELERSGYIFYKASWNYQDYLDEDGHLSWDKEYMIRQKHKNDYYEIPITQDMLYRRIPKETLVELNEYYQVSELTLKVYITLINYQELSFLNNRETMPITKEDIRSILGYKDDSRTDKRIGCCIHLLESLNLVEIERAERNNSKGATIPVYILKQVNFYIEYDGKSFDNHADDSYISEEERKQIREVNKLNYPGAFES